MNFLTDQIQALKFVQKYIASFGGDPAQAYPDPNAVPNVRSALMTDVTQVTIFGESAGSISVCSILCSPLSKGLTLTVIGP